MKIQCTYKIVEELSRLNFRLLGLSNDILKDFLIRLRWHLNFRGLRRKMLGNSAWIDPFHGFIMMTTVARGVRAP